jgi:hypothetical protein
MGEREHTKQPVEDHRPVEVEGVPEEEELPGADVEERVDLDPEEQPNRPEQADFDEAERRQYDDPPRQRTIADGDRPEDR